MTSNNFKSHIQGELEQEIKIVIRAVNVTWRGESLWLLMPVIFYRWLRRIWWNLVNSVNLWRYAVRYAYLPIFWVVYCTHHFKSCHICANLVNTVVSCECHQIIRTLLYMTWRIKCTKFSWFSRGPETLTFDLDLKWRWEPIQQIWAHICYNR